MTIRKGKLLARGQEKYVYLTSDDRYVLVMGMKSEELRIYEILKDIYDKVNEKKHLSFRFPIIRAKEGYVLMEKIQYNYHLKITNSMSFFDVRYSRFEYLDETDEWKQSKTVPKSFRIKVIEAIAELYALVKHSKIVCFEFELLINIDKDEIYIIDLGECSLNNLSVNLPSIDTYNAFYTIEKSEIDTYNIILKNRYEETLNIINL